jgi:hypothetical protein
MDPRYPIGKFEPPTEVTNLVRARIIGKIAMAPGQFRAAVRGLTEKKLDTPYREGGWTIRQLIHHVPDSHLNAYVRFKLALTEEEPTIKTYEQEKWAELADSQSTPIEVSLTLLEYLHDRWVYLLRSMKEQDFARKLKHPDFGVQTLDWMLFQYEWHGRHHTAHVTELRKAKGW